MGIGPIFPVQPDDSASASSQSSLTRRDRELQVEDGQPPIEVPEAELEALRRRKSEELRDRWTHNTSRKRADADGEGFDGADAEAADAEESEVTAQEQKDVQLPNKDFQEEESAGTLFDSRS